MIKRPNRYISDEGKAVWEQLERLERFGYAPDQSFSDWLDLMLNSYLSFTENFTKPDFPERLKTGNFEGKFNDRYMEIVRKYDSKKPKGERPIDYFANAFALLVKETDDKQ